VREGALFNTKCVTIFSTTFDCNISHCKKNSARYYHKCTQVSMSRNCYSCQILMKFELSRQILEKYSNIKFHEKPSSGSRVVPSGVKMAKLTFAFRNLGLAPKMTNAASPNTNTSTKTHAHTHCTMNISQTTLQRQSECKHVAFIQKFMQYTVLIPRTLPSPG
jgi:hypothetical protein